MNTLNVLPGPTEETDSTHPGLTLFLSFVQVLHPHPFNISVTYFVWRNVKLVLLLFKTSLKSQESFSASKSEAQRGNVPGPGLETRAGAITQVSSLRSIILWLIKIDLSGVRCWIWGIKPSSEAKQVGQSRSQVIQAWGGIKRGLVAHGDRAADPSAVNLETQTRLLGGV